MTTAMVLCPECRSMQKAGIRCPLCTFPIPEHEASPLAECREATIFGTRTRHLPVSKVQAILNLQRRGLI